MYKNARTVFQQKINNILNSESASTLLFEDIFKLQQILSLEKISNVQKASSDQWKVLLELFCTFGSLEFSKIITIVKGKTITFPSDDEYQDSIITTLCYYYKEVEGHSWDEVKNKLNMPKLNTIKYGIRVRQLKSFIDEQMIRQIRRKK